MNLFTSAGADGFVTGWIPIELRSASGLLPWQLPRPLVPLASGDQIKASAHGSQISRS